MLTLSYSAVGKVVPVSASGADVMTAFMSCAERQNIELHEIPKFSDLKQVCSADDLLY